MAASSFLLTSFSQFVPPGDAVLILRNPNNERFEFTNLNLDHLAEVCPLFAFSFEDGPHGKKRLVLSSVSVELMSRFLRYLHTKTYQCLDEQGEEWPCSLLMHCQLHHYGELYSVPGLSQESWYNIAMYSQSACSYRDPIPDMVDSLRYLYANMKDSQVAQEAILHYCVSCFVYHRLGANEAFRQLLADSRELQQDLFHVNMERGFSDEGSSHIIQLPLPPLRPIEQMTTDYLYEMFGSNHSTPMPTPLLSPQHDFTLVRRPRRPGKQPTTDDSDGYSSDSSQASSLHGFSLVERPKMQHQFPGSGPRNNQAAYHSHQSSHTDTQDPFADPPDSGSDSDWSTLSDDGDNEFQQLSVPRRASLKSSLYRHPEYAGSADTVVALTDRSEDLIEFSESEESDYKVSKGMPSTNMSEDLIDFSDSEQSANEVPLRPEMVTIK